MKNLVYLLLIVLVFSSTSSFAAFDPSKYFEGRVNLGIGSGHMTNSLDKRERFAALGATVDLQAELGPALLGFSILGMNSKTQYKENGVVVYAPYVGARLFGGIDLLAGLAIGEAKSSRKGWAASPDYTSEYSAKATGGFFGIRFHFGKGDKRIGLAVTGYNMSSDEYDVTKTSYVQVETKSKVIEKGAHFGGLITLFFSAGTGVSSGGKGKR